MKKGRGIPGLRLSKKFDSLLRDTKRTTRAMRGGCFLVSPSGLRARKGRDLLSKPAGALHSPQDCASL